jgi:hypothetical protein
LALISDLISPETLRPSMSVYVVCVSVIIRN